MLTKEEIRRMRTDAGLTQKEAAELLDISVSTVQNYEAGVTYPKAVVLERYSQLALIAYEYRKQQKVKCPLTPYRNKLKLAEFKLKESLNIVQAFLKEIEDVIGEEDQ